jgi:hypothetical protein
MFQRIEIYIVLQIICELYRVWNSIPRVQNPVTLYSGVIGLKLMLRPSRLGKEAYIMRTVREGADPDGFVTCKIQWFQYFYKHLFIYRHVFCLTTGP